MVHTYKIFYVIVVVPQVAVIGPPVSGKWCVASKISAAVKAPHLDPEGILNDAPRELQLEANKYTENQKVCYENIII